MICATTIVKSDGIYILMTDPQPSDVSTCPMVLANASEIGVNPFSLTVDQGVQIGGAILFLWAGAWVIRALAHLLNHESKEES